MKFLMIHWIDDAFSATGRGVRRRNLFAQARYSYR
jgi:hypothetical protein